jgi:hypothetical protein
MKNSTDGVEASFLLYLSALAVAFGVFVAVMYSLLQPTILPDAGVMEAHFRPKSISDWSKDMADRQRMEDAALEEARRANTAELPAATVEVKPREAKVRKEHSRKRTLISRAEPAAAKATPQPPQQFSSLLRSLFSF